MHRPCLQLGPQENCGLGETEGLTKRHWGTGFTLNVFAYVSQVFEQWGLFPLCQEPFPFLEVLKARLDRAWRNLV